MKKQLFAFSLILLALTSCNKDKSGPFSSSSGESVVDIESDRMNTQRIREAILNDPSFSERAKEIKIITVNNVVTIRGIVSSEVEKRKIGKLIKAIPTVRSLDNQLTVLNPEDEGAPGIQESKTD